MALKSGRHMGKISSSALKTPFFATSAQKTGLGGSRQIASVDTPMARGAKRFGIILFVLFILVGAGLYGFYVFRGPETPYAENLTTVLLLFSAIPAVVSFIAGRALAWVFS